MIPGAAIAALCAVSKGKAIGMIEPKEETDDAKAAKKEDKKQRARQGLSHPLPPASMDRRLGVWLTCVQELRYIV